MTLSTESVLSNTAVRPEGLPYATGTAEELPHENEQYRQFIPVSGTLNQIETQTNAEDLQHGNAHIRQIHTATEGLHSTGIQTEDNDVNENIIEQLRCRIRQLESQIHSRNVELENKGCLQRNYEAVLQKLIAVTAANGAIEYDRENYFREVMLCREQNEETTKKNEILDERLRESNRKLVECNKTVKTLEEKVCVLERACKNYQHIHQRSQTTQHRPKVGTESRCEERVSQPRDGKRRRHTFHQSLTVLPRCKNCSTMFDHKQPHEVPCRFHRLGPQPLKTWQKQFADGMESDLLSKQNYMFWPCCGQQGLKEPPGCLKLRSHDLVVPDD